MLDDFPPQYEPQKVQTAMYQKWLDAGVFHAKPDNRGPEERFSAVIPPPNVTGALHLGHAINATVQDILVRYHRMRGDNTLWMPGIDHAGIATQAVVEKNIFEQEKKSRHDLGREELVRRIWEWKERFGSRILEQLRSTGASCDWQRARFTLDEQCAGAVYEAFYRMYRDGLIFRGKRLVNWDTHLQTAVADDEVYHELVRGELVNIRYPVAGCPPDAPEYLTIATTRPETMLGDTAVAVHPDDARYRHLIGRHVAVPLVGRKIPVIADGLLVDPKFGTGVVKVTPAHDPNDYATGLRHRLEMINLLTPDGRVNDAGRGSFNGRDYSYQGLKFASEARRRVLEDLDALGLIAARTPHEHQVGHSDRSKTPIEPYLSDQWFVRMGDIPEEIRLASGQRASGLAQAAMDAVADGRVKIVPERYARGYLDWLGQKRDWCISRQLWWGHRIPVWTLQSAGIAHAAALADLNKMISSQRISAGSGVDAARPNALPQHICVRDATDVPAAGLLESLGYQQDPDVLDTWFSSALWPLSTMGWPKQGTSEQPEDQLLPYFYPTSVLSTAREILTLWVARMVMFGLYCHGEVPFKEVYIHAVIQDGQGRPMKKSLGNGVDPVDIVASHGADALRYTLASMATETQDIRLPVEKDSKTGRNTSPRFDVGRNFANKIWNASRFILGNCGAGGVAGAADNPGASQDVADRWILSRLNAAVAHAHECLADFRFADYANLLHQVFWTDLCDWYLEIAKHRIRQQDPAAGRVLLRCLDVTLRLLHPVMPFVTEAIWERMPGSHGLLALADFPAHDAALHAPEAEALITLVQAVTRAVRDVRNQYRVDLKTVLPVFLQTTDAATADALKTGQPMIAALANANIMEIGTTITKPADSATVVLPDVQVFVAGVIDADAEAKRLNKRQAELQKFIDSGRSRLADEAFVGKAPAKIVDNLRHQLEKQEDELRAIETNLQGLAK